jgi:hypothetical protein
LGKNAGINKTTRKPLQKRAAAIISRVRLAGVTMPLAIV